MQTRPSVLLDGMGVQGQLPGHRTGMHGPAMGGILMQTLHAMPGCTHPRNGSQQAPTRTASALDARAQQRRVRSPSDVSPAINGSTETEELCFAVALHRERFGSLPELSQLWPSETVREQSSRFGNQLYRRLKCLKIALLARAGAAVLPQGVGEAQQRGRFNAAARMRRQHLTCAASLPLLCVFVQLVYRPPHSSHCNGLGLQGLGLAG